MIRRSASDGGLTPEWARLPRAGMSRTEAARA
jgi:hypothetical protein